MSCLAHTDDDKKLKISAMVIVYHNVYKGKSQVNKMHSIGHLKHLILFLIKGHFPNLLFNYDRPKKKKGKEKKPWLVMKEIENTKINESEV